MLKIGIIIGSVRQNRVSPQVAEFFLNRANELNIEDVAFEIVDLKDYNLPEFDEPAPPVMLEEYSSQNIKDWGAKIDSLDGFIFVTPEYNKAIPASLKNALEHLGGEWGHKAAGIVSFGSTLGVAATLSLRQILSNLNVATITPFGAFNLFTDFVDGKFQPAEVHDATINNLINTTVKWAKGLKSVR